MKPLEIFKIGLSSNRTTFCQSITFLGHCTNALKHPMEDEAAIYFQILLLHWFGLVCCILIVSFIGMGDFHKIGI